MESFDTVTSFMPDAPGMDRRLFEAPDLSEVFPAANETLHIPPFYVADFAMHPEPVPDEGSSPRYVHLIVSSA